MQSDLLKDKSLTFEFYRSTGPGGQNVNKVSTAVRVRFDLKVTSLLSETAKSRLARLAGRQLTKDDVLLIEAQRFRTQEQNRTDAIQRLACLIIKALEEPKVRYPTQPTATARTRRMEAKRRRAALKRSRAKP